MGITLMMFSTGSMSPTIPAGSVAIVQEGPASEIEVGDVVTVDLGDLLPVTHRVTSVEPGAVDDQRIITMRGDANEQDRPPALHRRDSAHGAVTRFRGWRMSSSGSATHWCSAASRSPLPLLVGWAFWPRAEKPRELAEYTDQHEPGLAGPSQ